MICGLWSGKSWHEMDVKEDRQFEIIDTWKNIVKFEAWDKWKILLKKSMKYYPNNDMVLTWHDMMMIWHQGGVPFLLMWHFKMPREQKVTFQGIFGKRSYYTFKQLLGTCYECNGNTFKFDNRLVDTMKTIVERWQWLHDANFMRT